MMYKLRKKPLTTPFLKGEWKDREHPLSFLLYVNKHIIQNLTGGNFVFTFKTKKLIAVLLTMVLLCIPAFSINTAKAETAQPTLNLNLRSAILVEASSGKILFKLNEDVPYAPASMTKMMTEYIVLESIKQNKIKWDDKVSASEYAAFLGKPGGSSVLLAEGDVHTIKELYEAMAIYSANDATVLLAEKIAGSEANFVKIMNDKAQKFGMKNTHFATCTGFPLDELGEFAPPSTKGDNKMSARDAAILAKELITTYPEVLETTSIPKKVFRENTPNPLLMANWNWMLKSLIVEYEGVDGLKTGHTDEAKYCFTGTAKRNNMRLISVVMGADSELHRFSETKKLLNYGFSTYSMKTFLPENQTIKGYEKAPIIGGKDKSVGALTKNPVMYPVKYGEEEGYQLKAQLNEVNAPVKKGQQVGGVMITPPSGKSDDFLRPIDEKQAGGILVAQEDVEEAGWLRLAFRGFFGFIGDIFSGIGSTVKGWFS